MSPATYDGIALLFWVLIAIGVMLFAAGGIEWLMSRPSRRWLKRLHDIERGRAAQRGEL